MHPFLSPMTRQLYRANTFTESETGEFPSYRGFPPHVEAIYDTNEMDEDSFFVPWDNQMHPELSTIPPIGTEPRRTNLVPVGQARRSTLKVRGKD